MNLANYMGIGGCIRNASPCKLCNKDYTDIACHLIAECPTLYQERNILWEYIIDTVDVRRSVALSCLEDKHFTDIILGGKWTGLDSIDTEVKDKLYCEIVLIIHKQFLKGFKSNYSWFH